MNKIYIKQGLEKLEEMKALKQIKYFALHLFKDQDDWEYDRYSVLVEDVNGLKVEVSLPPYLDRDRYPSFFEDHYLMSTILIGTLVLLTCRCKNQMDEVERLHVECIKEGTINPLIAYGRKLAPYKGEHYVNEGDMPWYWGHPDEYLY